MVAELSSTKSHSLEIALIWMVAHYMSQGIIVFWPIPHSGIMSLEMMVGQYIGKEMMVLSTT